MNAAESLVRVRAMSTCNAIRNIRAKPGWSARHRAVTLFVAGGALLLGACAQEQDINAFVDPTVPADQTYNEALANIEAGDYTQARRSVTLGQEVVRIDGGQVQLGH